ncbi:MAG TPA: heme-binding domain-containing protein [Solirubrobacteraceae bacterium]|nr:heme-binding domain-containing protein [Solirubrobacteraceae bacterium]
MRRLGRGVIIILIVVLAGIQLLPYGRDHANPPVRGEPRWDSPRTRELAVRACFDCHSNETRWPWYSNVAPLSWLIQRDVRDGRRHLNFSEWDRPQSEAREAARAMQHGAMPPSYYTALNRSAELSESDWEALVAGLTATLGTSQERSGEHESKAGRMNTTFQRS